VTGNPQFSENVELIGDAAAGFGAARNILSRNVRLLSPKTVGPSGFKPGTFSISRWTGYPSGIARPKGPFRLLQGAEYDAARKAADEANAALRRADPGKYAGKQIHEIHPVKFGGSPTDPANKIALDPPFHRQLNAWWYRLQRSVE
jgi:hypothetical protein